MIIMYAHIFLFILLYVLFALYTICTFVSHNSPLADAVGFKYDFK